MDEQLAIALTQLGSDGIQAFYVYLLVKYGSLWALVGLGVWAFRIIWKKIKDDF